MRIHRFSVMVNCNLPDETLISDKVQDFEELHEDHGCLLLPESYTDTGAPTRLVISCHGAGDTVTTDDAQVMGQVMTRYLLANGYAVMDVNGLPQTYAAKRDIDLRNNVGTPIAVRSYVKAYHYCIEHFNLKREVFVHGGSMGGISSTNLVLCGAIPVIAHSAFCPVLDTYNEIFLHPWSGGLPKTALAKIYGFETDANGAYMYDEQKLCGYNPARNGRAKHYPVPVKFWHCVDDPVVSFAITRAFVDAIKKEGGAAYLRAFPYGGHEPQLVGKPIENPCGNTRFEGEELKILPAVEEVLIWIRNFD
ncbi:MAG: hypothetical protein E7624_04045 [Ruminococcaceae bacterium]|nr:hypothetical protein [Oscillospiraceae bacterium]